MFHEYPPRRLQRKLVEGSGASKGHIRTDGRHPGDGGIRATWTRRERGHVTWVTFEPFIKLLLHPRRTDVAIQD